MPPTGEPHDNPARDDAMAVVRRLREAGHVAYFAGGCVRDLLLGKTPKDFDVATDAPPTRVRELFGNTQAVGAAFGVILVRIRKSQIEVATFRAEGAYEDGRHPSNVRFTTAEEDAKRRDFTINGLFLDPLEDRVIDFVGGRADLSAGVIRAIGDPAERFEEDSLRLLRAVRFSARLGFALEPATAAAIVGHAPKLKRISPERIAEELRHMLRPPTRPAAWRMLWDLRLIETIYRFLKFKPDALRADPPFFFEHVAPRRPIEFALALAAGWLCYRMKGGADLAPLLHKPQVLDGVQAMRQALRVSNEESEGMRGALSALGPLLGDAPPTVAVMKRFLAEPTASMTIDLLTALSSFGLHSDRVRWLTSRFDAFRQTDFAPAPLIDGNDLQANGLKPGPAFKRILDLVYDAQLENRIGSREQAVALALSLAGSAPGRP